MSAQNPVDEAERLYDEAKTDAERKVWARDTLPKMDEVISPHSQNDKALSIRGLAKYELGIYKGAIEDCTKAIELNNKNARAWSIRGLARSATGNTQKALDDCTKAIEFAPKDTAMWSNRGAVQIALRKFQSAIDDCTTAIELDEKNENEAAWSNRGLANYHLGKYDDALKDFGESLRLDSKNKRNQRNMQAVMTAMAGAEKAAEKAKDTLGTEDEYRKELEKKSRRFHRNYIFNIIFRIIFFIMVMGIISGFIVALDQRDIFSKIAEDKNSLRLLPYLALLFAILSPFIWLIRINLKVAERNLTLAEDYDGRLTAELYLERFLTEERDRREFAQKYIVYWMYNNPSETMIRLANKSTNQPELPQVEQIRNFTKNTPTDQ